LEIPGNEMCEESKKEIMGYATMEKGNQHQNTKRPYQDVSMKDM